jgi:hypothetical protein
MPAGVEKKIHEHQLVLSRCALDRSIEWMPSMAPRRGPDDDGLILK